MNSAPGFDFGFGLVWSLLGGRCQFWAVDVAPGVGVRHIDAASGRINPTYDFGSDLVRNLLGVRFQLWPVHAASGIRAGFIDAA